MCGIAGIHRLNGTPAPGLQVMAEEMLLALELRGRDAAGWATLDDRGSACIRKDTKAAHRFVKAMKKDPTLRLRDAESVRTLMVHTRFATVGAQTAMNAHPHACGTVAAVHNGTIWNADELFDAFNLKRRCTVDSEVIPALVNEFGWENAASALELLDGGAAVALMSSKHPRDLILARVHDYPLVWINHDGYILWASQASVIHRAWERATGKALPERVKFNSLADGQMVHVHDGKVVMSGFSPLRPAFHARRWTSTGTVPAKRSPKKARQAQKQLERFAEQATLEYVASRFTDSGRDEEVAYLMADGFTRNEAELIVDEGLEALEDVLADLTDGEVDATPWEDDFDDLGNYTPRWRGAVESKSPATLAEEALGA